MKTRITMKLDRGDVKILRRMVEEVRSGNNIHAVSNAAFLEECLDEAEGLSNEAGVRLVIGQSETDARLQYIPPFNCRTP